MEGGAFKRLAKRARRRGYRGRSDAYRWLRRRHGSLSGLFAAHEPAWADVAAEMTAAGIAGGRGKPLTADAVRRMWARVCRDVAMAPAAKPNRAGPAGWRPALAAAIAKPTSAPRAEAEAPSGGLSGKAMLDDLWADIERRSGRR